MRWQGCLPIHPHGKQARLATLTLCRSVGDLQLKGKHLALHGGWRQEWHHGIGRTDSRFDLSRPFNADLKMAVDENTAASLSELLFNRGE